MAANKHSDKNADSKAVLHRQGNKHRENGHAHIGGAADRRGVYDNLTQIKTGLRLHKPNPINPPKKSGIDPFSDAHAARYTFAIFSPTTGGPPYPNEAHHLIPIEFFGLKILTGKGIEVMRTVDYNVNNGANIIFLPNSASKVLVHALPVHYRSHPKYNKAVITEGNKIRQALLKAIKKDQAHADWDPPANLVSELESLQKAMWNLVVSMVERGMTKLNMFQMKNFAVNAAK